MKFPTSIVATLFCVALHFPLAAAPELQADSELATAGYFQLSWKSDIEADFLLQESTDPSFSQFSTLYEGPDTATLISGRKNGEYYYRIRTIKDGVDTEWSNVTSVKVNHHPLSRAFMFFGLGAIVFASTLVVVIVGSKTYN